MRVTRELPDRIRPNGVHTAVKRPAEYSQCCAHTIAALLLFGTPCVGLSQTVAAKADTTVAPSYDPSMGDLMTMTVQPRHSSLDLRESNRIASTPSTNSVNCATRLAASLARFPSSAGCGSLYRSGRSSIEQIACRCE